MNITKWQTRHLLLLTLSLFLGPIARAADTAPINQTYYDQQHWSVFGYYGKTSSQVVGHVLTGHIKPTGEVITSLEASYLLPPNNPFRYFFHPIVDNVELAMNVSRRTGGDNPQAITEFVPYVYFAG